MLPDGIEIRCCDCLSPEGLPSLADGSVDMILADLPYGTTECEWDSVIPLEPLWTHYKRIIKPRGAIVLTASQPFTTILIASNLEWFKYCWVWEKSNAGDCMNAKNKPMKKHEDIAVFSSGTTANRSPDRMPYYPQGLRPTRQFRGMHRNKPGVDGGSFKPARPSHKAYVQEWENHPTSVLHFPNDKPAIHPTQKPVDLFLYLILTYTQPGDLVVDNALGSGTTVEACYRLGRRCIGMEKEPNYVEIAKSRLRQQRLIL